ncbi:hypothetical protein ACHAWC_008408 [Mediolabrus comicus]
MFRTVYTIGRASSMIPEPANGNAGALCALGLHIKRRRCCWYKISNLGSFPSQVSSPSLAFTK